MSKNSKSIYGLPAQSYTDQGFLDNECKTVLADGWLFIGFVHEFLKSGDAVPVTIAGNLYFLLEMLKMKFSHFIMFALIDVLN